MTRYSTEQQTQIIKMKSEGKTSRKIASELGLSKSGVNEWYNREHKPLFGREPVMEKLTIIEASHNEDNSVILVISDMHIPYHHKNLIPFLKGLKEKYNPTRVICLGDELDLHSLSFHDSDPDLMSAGDELKEAMKVIKQVEELFPIMDLVDSNHGSLAYRKAKHHGIPQHFIKGYNEVLEVGEGWKWHHDLTVKLPNGEDVYICHGKAARGVQLSQNMGMSVVQGHHHSEFNIHYWANPKHLHFSVQCGSLIDDKSLAMAYNKLTLKRPIIGTALIVNGVPVLEAMPL